jgi:hypothetical protein
MGPIHCPETSVNNFHTTPRNIPEERRSHQLRGGSLKSKKVTYLLVSLEFPFLFSSDDTRGISGVKTFPFF